MEQFVEVVLMHTIRNVVLVDFQTLLALCPVGLAIHLGGIPR
jgi:hypothetical protein